MRIETTRHLHCTVLRATGVLDHAGRVLFSDRIEAVWNWSVGPVLVFDLADLDFFDSSVIGVLGMVMQRMEEEEGGGRIFLVRPSEHLLSALRQTDLLSHVERRGSVAETVAELTMEAEAHHPDGARAGAPGLPNAARPPSADLRANAPRTSD